MKIGIKAIAIYTVFDITALRCFELMQKITEQFPLITLDGENNDLPLYRQIYEAIRSAILRGELASKTRLPSSRNLAQNLGVSRITVVNAYDQLFAEGYLEGKTGSGTFIAAKLPDDLLQTTDSEPIQSETKTIARLDLSPFGEKLAFFKAAHFDLPPALKIQPFRHGLSAIDEFPFEIWSRIAAKYYKNPPRSLLVYGDSRGFRPLREAIAAHLKAARGVICTAEQVIITSGAQQALDLTARIFLSAEDAVLIENPCYLEARKAFSATGATLIPTPVDEEGLNLAQIPVAGENAKLVYVTPSHQYPLGVTMSLPRRLQLLDWARTKNAWIVEDDYDSEYRYAGRPLAALQGLDKTGRVIYIGTFSKTIFPSLRIGCAVVPPELVEIFTTARALNDVQSSSIEQAVLAEFIAEGHFARHIRRMRQLYEKRQRILVAEGESRLKNLLEVKKDDAGMHLVGWLPEDVDDRAIAAKAAEKSLHLTPLSRYFAGATPRGGFILGYTAFDEQQIKEGVTKIRQILL